MYRPLVLGSLLFFFLLSVFTLFFLLLVAHLSECEHLVDTYIKIRNDGAMQDTCMLTSERMDLQGKLNYRPGMDLSFILFFPNIIPQLTENGRDCKRLSLPLTLVILGFQEKAISPFRQMLFTLSVCSRLQRQSNEHASETPAKFLLHQPHSLTHWPLFSCMLQCEPGGGRGQRGGYESQEKRHS